MSGSYPLYHTSYETFKLMKNHLDQDFTVGLILNLEKIIYLEFDTIRIIVYEPFCFYLNHKDK